MPERDAGIECASWLGPTVLLVVARVGLDARAAVEARASHNGSADGFQCRSLVLGEGSTDEAEGVQTVVMLVHVAGPPADAGLPGKLSVGAKAGALELDEAELEEALTDTKSLLRRCIAPRDACTRNQVSDFLARAATDPGGRLRPGGEALHAVREALRERLPAHRNAAGSVRGLAVEHLLVVGDGGYYVQGWMRDEEAEIVRLTAVSPEGARCELAGRMFRYARQDVEQFFSQHADFASRPGFLCYFETGTPSVVGTGWLFEMENAEGVVAEVEAPRVIDDINLVRDTILNDPFRQGLPDPELMAGHVHPALSKMQDRVQEMIEVAAVTEFGTPPPSPEVSIVVPVYKRIDHLEAQLAEFADDPQIHASDLIYVLDSPEDADAMLHLAAQLYPIYRVPFRVAVLRRNVGFAGANNAGISLARGRLLLLMNSDILPAAPGWLETMRDYYDSKPGIGALGPKLMYEDDSIQHAGMYFYQPPGSKMWLDAHLFKGLHRSFDGANVARPVPAVSGACVMIDRELYGRIGFRGIYVRGDYEDFDLCLRLIEDGHENWYLPEAELYHLEAQSYSGDLRFPSNRYNMWLHTHLWGERIPELMERYEYLAELTEAD